MKYMTFNRSCSYAALANLLEKYGHNYEDHEIVKALSIPYLLLFDEQEKCYVAGAMIQSQVWFNYFLNSLGFDFIEEWFNPESAIECFDKNVKNYMLGVQISEYGNSKHAVIFENKMDKKYCFLNPKRKDSTEPNYYYLEKNELDKKLPLNFPMAYLENNQKILKFDASKQLELSLNNLDKYKNEIIQFCSKEQNVNTILEVRDALFAPLLLDILTMMELIGEDALAKDIKNIQSNFMKAIKENDSVLLTNYITIDQVDDIIFRYKKVVKNYTANYKP
ncbi:MAG: hypothetical protein FWG77_06180 [Treponema sp.]|nr:hypothetical protein [Treponema sp.]